MADGELTLKLDEATARRLQEAADAAGRPVGDYAADLIGVGLDNDWADALTALAEFDRTGVSYSIDEGMVAFDAAVKIRLSAKS